MLSSRADSIGDRPTRPDNRERDAFPCFESSRGRQHKSGAVEFQSTGAPILVDRIGMTHTRGLQRKSRTCDARSDAPLNHRLDTTMQPERSLPRHAGKKSLSGPYGIDLAWPRTSQSNQADGTVVVAPVARGLSILSAFTPDKPSLGNQEIADATGIPPPTVLRLLRSLVALGYLHRDDKRKRYSLASASLALGYAAIADPEMLRLASIEMRAFAEATDTYVLLGTRDRLDVILLETHVNRRSLLELQLSPGMHVPIAYSMMGWALLAALPEDERQYLRAQVERHAGDAWPPAIRHRMNDKIAQVHELGFCMLHGEWEPELTCVAAPLTLPGRPPLVLCCVGRTARVAQAAVERELGARLVACARVLQERLPARR
ncbi:IclR family transcriptional regulator [Burkholderia lata]|nr:IclR family transcriptional regulator [Burkholderia lata]